MTDKEARKALDQATVIAKQMIEDSPSGSELFMRASAYIAATIGVIGNIVAAHTDDIPYARDFVTQIIDQVKDCVPTMPISILKNDDKIH